jgi:hypothetical protein
MEENNKAEEYISHKLNAGYTYMVFRNDRNGKTFYKIGVKQKDLDGQEKTCYIPISFKKGVDVEDKTKIKIKQAIENVYAKGYDTIFTYKILEFDNLSDAVQEYAASADELDLPF